MLENQFFPQEASLSKIQKNRNGAFNSEIGGRAELELGAMVPDGDSTSMIGDRNNITSEEDDSPSPPLSTVGKPKEWSFPGGLWEHRERCHLFRREIGS